MDNINLNLNQLEGKIILKDNIDYEECRLSWNKSN